MQPAARLQLERMIGEFVRWRAVPDKQRSPAPAWWWGPAMELRDTPGQLPAEWSVELGLSRDATCAAAADVFLKALSGQTLLPWPYDFPSKTDIPDPAVRDLHVQPSDDSAFPP